MKEMLFDPKWSLFWFYAVSSVIATLFYVWLRIHDSQKRKFNAA